MLGARTPGAGGEGAEGLESGFTWIFIVSVVRTDPIML